MTDKCDVLVVIPFFNEQLRLPEILRSLVQSAGKKYKVHLVMIDHLSTDSSTEVISKFSEKFLKLDVIQDNFPIHCGGHPRSMGIKKAISLAKDYYFDEKIPIVTIDADVIVSKKFISEVVNKLQEGFDIVSFCERYNPIEFLEFINKQKNINLAIKSFIGLNWLRYQVLWGLVDVGIKETRGPGGYAIKTNTLRLLDHKQPFDENSKPVTGENNRLGIIAYRKNLKVYLSPYCSRVHPRREIFSCKNICQKGYLKNKENDEVFKLARELDQYPILTDSQISDYMINGIKRTIRMILIRAIAYNKLNIIRNWFHHPVWKQMVEISIHYVEKNNPSDKTLEVIGSGFYNDLFDFVVSQIGKNKFENFVKYLKNKIPNKKNLEIWINDKSLVIEPETSFI